MVSTVFRPTLYNFWPKFNLKLPQKADFKKNFLQYLHCINTYTKWSPEVNWSGGLHLIIFCAFFKIRVRVQESVFDVYCIWRVGAGILDFKPTQKLNCVQKWLVENLGTRFWSLSLPRWSPNTFPPPGRKKGPGGRRRSSSSSGNSPPCWLSSSTWPAWGAVVWKFVKKTTTTNSTP